MFDNECPESSKACFHVHPVKHEGRMPVLLQNRRRTRLPARLIQTDFPSANMEQPEAHEQAIVVAIEREQKRLANELHDGVCQELAGVAMMIDAKRHRVSSEIAIEMGSIAEHIRLMILDIRRLALGLAPAAVEHAGLAGALALLKMNVEALRGPSVVVSVEEQFTRELSLDMAVNLYRIAQEATANATAAPPASLLRPHFPPKAFCLLSKTTAAESEMKGATRGVSGLSLWLRARLSENSCNAPM
jgi:signal transduction histidine kinase